MRTGWDGTLACLSWADRLVCDWVVEWHPILPWTWKRLGLCVCVVCVCGGVVTAESNILFSFVYFPGPILLRHKWKPPILCWVLTGRMGLSRWDRRQCLFFFPGPFFLWHKWHNSGHRKLPPFLLLLFFESGFLFGIRCCPVTISCIPGWSRSHRNLSASASCVLG